MVDLFRYIEQDFAVPSRTDAIDVSNDSDFQQALGAAVEREHVEGERPVAEEVRAIAEDYLARHFPSPTEDPLALGDPLSRFGPALQERSDVTPAELRQLVETTFGNDLDAVLVSAEFAGDLELLQNAVVAVKLLTGFDRVDVARVAGQLRAAALLGSAAQDASVLGHAEIRRLLSRPLRVPSALLAAVAPARSQGRSEEPPSDGGDEQRQRVDGLRRERDRLQSAYDALLAVRPEELEIALRDEPQEGDRPEDGPRDGPTVESSFAITTAELRLSDAAISRFGDDELAALEPLRVDPRETAVPVVVDRVLRRLTRMNDELLPLAESTAATVFRVGGQLFAATDVPETAFSAPAPASAPDFGKAVTRPVGVGNLQVVRQELIGYRAGEISHIENVLEGEELRRRTRRTEHTELIESDEMVTAQTEERDRQSTDRNELVAETQRESGQQHTSSGEGMTSSDYGRLVENSKSNHAQTVVAKSAEKLTQEVRRRRVRRENRTFVEQAAHILDNADGTTKVRGIYQWVDKAYSLRVLNYGKRLMYDVVVPEPAAVLVQALKDAARPESFQLVKPLEPSIQPSDLNESNYRWFAAQYGVTGSVTPPPLVYDRTVSQVQLVEGTKQVRAYGNDTDLPHHAAFKLTVPEGYKAVAGYVQRINATSFEVPGRMLEVFVGERTYLRLGGAGNPQLNASFTMAGETGEVPVTTRTFAQLFSLAYAVALVCQRTDQAYAQWQLKTHATITSGFQRQRAEYEDKLNRYVAAARAQLAAAGGLAHDPAVTLHELKRAFVFLLVGEHPATWLPTPTPAPAPPGASLPDPLAVRQWGAVVAFFERAFEWENLMFTCYPYYWARPQRWPEMMLTQDADPGFEAFLKAGAARVVVPVRPGFEGALAHFHETGDVWMGEEIPDMFGDHYLSIIEEMKAANAAPGSEQCVEQWEVTLPTTLVLLKDDAVLPTWPPTPCDPTP